MTCVTLMNLMKKFPKRLELTWDPRGGSAADLDPILYERARMWRSVVCGVIEELLWYRMNLYFFGTLRVLSWLLFRIACCTRTGILFNSR